MGYLVAYPLARQFPGPDDGISAYSYPRLFYVPSTFVNLLSWDGCKAQNDVAMEKHYFRVYGPGDMGQVKMFCVLEPDTNEQNRFTLKKWDYETGEATENPIVDGLEVGLQAEVTFLLGALDEIKTAANGECYVNQHDRKILLIAENEFSCTEREFTNQV